MKNKRILSRALALALTLSMLPVPTMAVRLGDGLSDKNKYIYDKLSDHVEQIAVGNSSSAVVSLNNISGQSIKPEDLNSNLIMKALLADLPYHLYWFDKTSGMETLYYTNSATGIIDSLKASFAVGSSFGTGNQVSAEAVKLAQAANEEAGRVIKYAEGLQSDYEKLQYCFEYVKNKVVYGDPESAESYPWQMLCVFDQDSTTNPVCEGYAKAFKYLCDGLGIECYLVSGKMDNGDHMWNIIRLDNQSYLVDVTNCDDNSIGADDLLFLKKPASRSANSYTFSMKGKNVVFTYDEGTINLFDSVGMNYVLELAEEDYDPDSANDGSGNGENVPVVGYTVTTSGGATVLTSDGVTVDNRQVAAGELLTVRLSGIVQTGYTLDQILVNDEPITKDGNGSYTFRMPEEDVMVKAVWKKIAEYTVTFEINGQTVKTQMVREGQPVDYPGNVEMEGYTFEGWFLDGVKYNFDTKITGDIKLVAKLTKSEAVTYTVKFDSNGGSAVDAQTVKKGGKVTKPADPIREGYSFDGWYDVTGGKFDFSTPVTGNMTLVAKWIEELPEVVTYTVKFDSNGGSAVAAQSITEGKTASKPADPTREGYSFDGWFCGGKPFSFDTAITADTVLTAVWTKVHTVTFDFNGLSGNKSFEVDDGSYIDGLIADPVRQGYEFAGWYLNDEPFDFNLTAITTDTVLTARWMKDGSLVNVYTVSFDTGVYGLNIAPQKVEGGSAVEKPADPVRSGYTFLHWLLNSVEYDFTAPVNQNMTLTALWEKIQVVEPEKPTTPSRPSKPDYDDDDRDYVDMTGGGSGSGSTGGSSTTTEKNPDGSTTTTTKDNNGTVVENTKYSDGSSVQIKTDKNGTVTTTEKDAKGNQTQTVEKADGSKEFTANQKDGSKATASVATAGTVAAEVDVSKKAVQEAAKTGEAVQLPIPAVTSEKGGKASTVTVDLPKNSGKVNVVIPVAEVTPGTVAVIVFPDGTEEVVIQSKLTEAGLGLTLEGGATLKIVDNSKRFDDVKPNDWFNNATDFVSSRNLFAGTSETEFSPNAPMTMEMLFAVAHNFMGKPETTASGVVGAKPEDWFHTASNWAAEVGLTAGLKMNMLGSNQPISREDTAILLFNLSGKADSYIPSPEALAKLNAFTDIADMDPANLTALAWAVENGIMNGMGDGSFGFKGNNTRAQTGAVMMNFNNNL